MKICVCFRIDSEEANDSGKDIFIKMMMAGLPTHMQAMISELIYAINGSKGLTEELLAQGVKQIQSQIRLEFHKTVDGIKEF